MQVKFWPFKLFKVHNIFREKFGDLDISQVTFNFDSLSEQNGQRSFKKVGTNMSLGRANQRPMYQLCRAKSWKISFGGFFKY